MAHHMGLITGDPSLPQEEVQRLVEREILPYLLEFHAGTNLNSIPAKSQKLLSRLHYDPRDEKFESIVKLSAAQQAFVDTVCKCTASEKAFKELETAYDDHSSQANEVNKRVVLADLLRQIQVHVSRGRTLALLHLPTDCASLKCLARILAIEAQRFSRHVL